MVFTPCRPRARRWGGRIVIALVIIVVFALGVTYGVSESRMRSAIVVPTHPLVVPMDSAAIDRGRHVADVRGCTSCHTPSLAGSVRLDNFVVGRVAAPNLTNGRRGGPLSVEAWERAVRHGVRTNGRPMLFMPSLEFNPIADDELAAVIAYARSLPATADTLPAATAGPLARVLMLSGVPSIAPARLIDHQTPHPATVSPRATADYGKYVASACVGCHRAGFEGGPITGMPSSMPRAANLTPTGIGRWSDQDFVRAMREGKRPDGSAIRPPMPLKITRAMTDVELAAVLAYLRSLPPRESAR